VNTLTKLFVKWMRVQVSVPDVERLFRDEVATRAVEQFAKLDFAREVRTGFPEVVFGEGKSIDHLGGIFQEAERQKKAMFGTRISRNAYFAVRESLQSPGKFEYFEKARIASLSEYHVKLNEEFKVSILTGGTADHGTAEEAAVTLELNGISPRRVYDVGVAGLDRLLSQTEALSDSSVIIAVAGMEGALPSVVAGLVSCPVLAVPTSVGYGASFGGLVPLLAMINGCAPGVSILNIDNGFGAAACALKIYNSCIPRAN